MPNSKAKPLTLTDLVDSIHEELGLTKAKTKETLELALRKIQTEANAGNEVRLYNFGTFKLKQRAARKGRNPQTGAPMDIAASSAISFKPAKNKK